jgi:hypothetical protein
MSSLQFEQRDEVAKFEFTKDDIATIKTAFNTSILVILFTTLNIVFDWDITVEHLLPFVPIIFVVLGMFYRTSLVITKKWPNMGYILFGVRGEKDSGS